MCAILNQPSTDSYMRIVIVSGLSGSGKSMALHTFEDHGFFCIDNLPLELLIPLLETSAMRERENIAIGADVRTSGLGLSRLPKRIQSIRDAGHEVTLVYLHTAEEILLKRYNETRRKHPLTSADLGLKEALAKERELMSAIRNASDLEIDTSTSSIYELANRLAEQVCQTGPKELSILLQSFGFKHGVPGSTDFIFDVRCLPNPHWVLDIRKFNGLEKPVKEWLEGHEDVTKMYEQIGLFIENWLPNFVESHRSYLTVSIGCTGGKHRSVYLAEKLGKRFQEKLSNNITVYHRELKGNIAQVDWIGSEKIKP